MQNNDKALNKVHKRVLTGVVTSDKMNKTIVVKVARLAKHPMYKKVIKKYSSFKVHDEKAQAKTGDTVRIIECRPISKEKHFRLISITRTQK